MLEITAIFSIEKPLSVEIRYNTLDGHKRIALAISAMWKEILGVETTLITIPQGWHPLLELALIITIGVTFG